MVHREADRRRLADRHRVHHPPAPHQHVVRPLAADLQPLRLLLLPGAVDRDRREGEPVLLRQLLERPDRLLAVGGVVVEERDLLPLQAAAVLVEQVLHDDRGRVPVGPGIVEHPLEGRAVRRARPPVAHGVQRDPVLGHLGDDLVGDPGRQRLQHQRVGAAHLLVALDAAGGVIGGLALRHRRLHPADPAVALVQQREIVGIAVGERRAARGIGPGPVAQRRKVQLRQRRPGRERAGQRQRHPDQPHRGTPPLVCLAQCGNGQSRSFSFASRQSCASPCGSTIRKKMISAPEQHRLHVRREIRRPAQPRHHEVLQEDRHQHHERRPGEAAEDRARARR